MGQSIGRLWKEMPVFMYPPKVPLRRWIVEHPVLLQCLPRTPTMNRSWSAMQWLPYGRNRSFRVIYHVCNQKRFLNSSKVQTNMIIVFERRDMPSVGLSHTIVCQGLANQIIPGRAVVFPFWDPIHMWTSLNLKAFVDFLLMVLASCSCDCFRSGWTCRIACRWSWLQLAEACSMLVLAMLRRARKALVLCLLFGRRRGC